MMEMAILSRGLKLLEELSDRDKNLDGHFLYVIIKHRQNLRRLELVIAKLLGHTGWHTFDLFACSAFF